MFELGMLHKQKGDIDTAITVIENAKYVFFFSSVFSNMDCKAFFSVAFTLLY